MWGLKAPSGLIVQEVVGATWSDVWVQAYELISRSDKEWGERYWKRWEPSIRSAKRRGYRIIKVKIVAA